MQLQHAMTTTHEDTLEARIRNSRDTQHQCAHLLIPIQMHRHHIIHNVLQLLGQGQGNIHVIILPIMETTGGARSTHNTFNQ
eukprot:496568-Prorocentrum_lima.AAC.1